MALTPHYGLSFFGGNTPGALSDDGAKYTGADRILLDRMLHALASSRRHLHDYQAVSDPGTPTAVVSDDDGGGLPAGATYFYVVTYVDADGLESLPSAQVEVSTPAAIDPPGSPTLTDELSDGTPIGGNLPPGLHYYALTAQRGDEESILGPQVSITLIDDTSSVAVTLPEPPDTGLTAQLWRMAADDAGWTRIATGAFTTGAQLLDDGTVTANLDADDPSQAPPATNSGQDVYSVTVTLASADQPLATDRHIAAWRLYRTETSGAWPASSLVQHVVATTDPSGDNDPSYGLVVAFRDDGDILLDGLPPTTAQAMTLTPFVFDNVASLPAYTGYPLWYPVIFGGQLYARGSSGWVPLSGGGSGSVQIFTQDMPASVWTIPHAYPYPPAVTVCDSTGRQVLADITHDDGVVTVTSEFDLAGTAHLS